MAGKVAVLNDLAGFGRCSLTAAISVLSAMGVQPCPLPTAVLSAQTGFESYFFQDLTEQMGMITEEWKKSGAQFDGIVTGFMSDHRQIGEVNHFLDLFHKEGTFLLVDPVLGDNGKRFSVFDGLFQKEMKQLVKRADIVTPNVTELCLLTDYDYDKIQNISETGDREALFLEVSKAASVEFTDKNTFICGGNGTGKTTLQDAFLWLLFGKDTSVYIYIMVLVFPEPAPAITKKWPLKFITAIN